VIYTYDVKWETSELTWSHRWDVYLKGNPDDEIHYFSIVNSLMIVLFLTGVVAMIMLRTLHKVGFCMHTLLPSRCLWVAL
jgi:transmembrane 9 superfamily protein 2/4